MELTRSSVFADVYLLKTPKHSDERGFFTETFRVSWFDNIAPELTFLQDNHSYSKQGVLRGLHYQLERPQGKLVRVIRGKIFDVVVDLRKNSTTFGRWQGFELSAENRQQLWIPPGFAHGFYTVSAEADCLYRCTDYYHAASERTIRWDDADLSINWPLVTDTNNALPLVSAKDQQGAGFQQADYFSW